MRLKLLLFLAVLLGFSSAEARMHAGPNVLTAGHRLKTPGGPLDGAIVSAPAAVGYSFRRLRAAYAGPAAKIRRTTGGTLDVGFTTGGDFDTAAATAFCNATTCFIDTWYDQSGNARDVAQAAMVNQPALVFNCIGTLPCARTTAVAQQMFTASVTWASVITSLSAVERRSAGTGICYFIRKNAQVLASQNVANTWTTTGFAGGGIDFAATDNAWHAGIGIINGAASVARADATETTGSITGASVAGTVAVAYGAATTTCDQTEAILWDGYALTATERASLVANQTQYWMPAPLDTFAAPAAAYSLRKLKSTYAGPAIRLRRASDNAEQDINFLGFVPGLGAPFDVAAANAFCAATSCFLAKWYDQSGNGRDAVQATAANQPPLAFNCIGTLPCLQLTSAAVGVQSGNVTPATGVVSLNAAGNRAAGAGACWLLFQNGGGGNRLTYRGVPGLALWGGTSGNVVNGSPDNSWRSVTGVLNGASSTLNDNGGTVAATATGSAVAGTIGNLGAASTTCLQTEAILWDNYVLTTAEIAALTANQRQFWGF